MGEDEERISEQLEGLVLFGTVEDEGTRHNLIASFGYDTSGNLRQVGIIERGGTLELPISRTYLLTPNDRVLSSSSIDSVTVTLTTIDSTNNARCPAVLEMTRSEDEWMGTLRIDSLIGIDGHKKEYAQGIPRDIKLKEFKLDEVASSQE